MDNKERRDAERAVSVLTASLRSGETSIRFGKNGPDIYIDPGVSKARREEIRSLCDTAEKHFDKKH